MRTFEEVFCQRHRCDRRRFRKLLFRLSLYPHARPFALVMGEQKNAFFAPDFALVDAVAPATDLQAVVREVLEFKNDFENRKWLRRRARIRISGVRLQRVARSYLPA